MIRNWLHEVPPELKNRMAARRTMENYRAWWGKHQMPRCPGCRKWTNLVYLEFRNWEPEDTFKTPHVIAVCKVAKTALLYRMKRGEVFGVTALIKLIPWACKEKSPATKLGRKHNDPKFLESLARARAAKKALKNRNSSEI